MDAFSDNFLSGDDFEAVFSVFMTMVKTLLRQLVEEIFTDENDYGKFSSCVTVCYIAKAYHQRLGRRQRSEKKLQKTF